MEMKTLKCIIGDTLRHNIRDEDIIRDICEIQDIKWARIGRRAWRDHVNKTDDKRLTKSLEMGN